MSNVFVEDSSLSAIAEAIREKLQISDQMLPAEMAPLIASIVTGAQFGYGKMTFGTYTPESDVTGPSIDTGLSECRCFFFMSVDLLALAFAARSDSSA